MTDAGAGVLRVYDSTGRQLEMVARPGAGPLELNSPGKISAIAEGYLVQDAESFVFLDREFESMRGYDLESFPVAPEGTVHWIVEWEPAGSRLYGMGALRLPDGSWRSGFLSMAIEDPTEYRFLRDVPVEDRQEYDHYPMGSSHVAVLEGRGYFLAMAEEPRILEADAQGSVRWLEAFPGRFSTRPMLPLSTGPASGEIRFRAFEKASLAVGLYAGAERLFVLGREPLPDDEGGGTRWTLTRIDPRPDRVEGTVVLPTRANHLSVVPGPERWALLEKGRMERIGVQPIPTLLFVPAAWIEGDESPLGIGIPAEVSCETG